MNNPFDVGGSPLDEEPQVDLTPLIDCLFMLIIFFVLTMSFSRPVLEIILPESQTAQSHKADRQVSVYVTSDGQYLMNKKPTNLKAIEAELAKNDKAILNIHMDAKASFDRFVPLVDLAKSKNEGRFVISTQPSK